MEKRWLNLLTAFVHVLTILMFVLMTALSVVSQKEIYTYNRLLSHAMKGTAVIMVSLGVVLMVKDKRARTLKTPSDDIYPRYVNILRRGIFVASVVSLFVIVSSIFQS